MKRRLTTVLLAAATVLGTGAAASADLTHVEPTDPSKAVELQVEIEWGSIRIRGSKEATRVTIEARPDRSDEISAALVAARVTENVVVVRQTPLASGAFRSANLDIETPLATSVRLRVNRGGDIRVQSVEGLVEVTNLNGSVELAEISGAAAVNASNGSIIAGFSKVDPELDMFFGSLNGSVELCLPPGFSARAHLTTAGDPIRSDFEIELDDPAETVGPGEVPAEAQSEVSGRIGSGTARLRVSTLNGEITLERCD